VARRVSLRDRRGRCGRARTLPTASVSVGGGACSLALPNRRRMAAQRSAHGAQGCAVLRRATRARWRARARARGSAERARRGCRRAAPLHRAGRRAFCAAASRKRAGGAHHTRRPPPGPAGGLDVSRRATLSLSRHRRAARPAVSGETTMFASFSSLVESVDLSALADHAGKVRGCRAARLSRRAGGVLTRAGACFARSALAACAAGFRAAGGPGEERRQRAGLPGAGAAGRRLRTAAAAARRRERAVCPGRASRRPAAAAGRASATAAAGAGRVCHQRGGGGSPGSAAGRATQRWRVPSAAARAAALAARAAPAACARARRRCIATRPRPGRTGCFLAPSRVRCRRHAQR